MEEEVEEEEEGIEAGVGAAVAAGTGGENMIDYDVVSDSVHKARPLC